MWRPKDWETIYFDYWDTRRSFLPEISRQVYEAGADAMLRAIWKLAEDSPTGTFTFDTHTYNVFIPDEEAK